MTPQRAIYTAGHGTRSTDELADLLLEAGITTLIDVRRFPASRRHPHLGRESLSVELPSRAVAYEWQGETLGGRRSRGKGPPRHPALRDPAFQGYAEHMEQPAFRRALEALERRAGSGERLCVMCAETLWWRCHRRLIADALLLRGTTVIHLLSPGKRQGHVLTDGARAGEGGWPVYDVGESGSLFG